MKKTVKRIITAAILAFILVSALCISASAEAPSAEEANVFSEGFEAIKAHSSEIFSALAFCASLLLAMTYKKGLIPAMKKSIAALAAAVSEIKKSEEGAIDTQKSEFSKINERMGILEEYLKKAEEALGKSEQILEKLNTDTAYSEKIRTVISEQVSMLYDVFMFSSIPEYQKDAIGRRVEKMRNLIAEGEVSENAAKGEN